MKEIGDPRTHYVPEMPWHKKTVAIIPARGGSKGIPDKNLAEIRNKPLIGWTIGHALGAKHIDSVYVSTDSEEIGEVATEYGADVIQRPKHMSKDDSPAEQALIHGVYAMPTMPETLVMLQCTSPLRFPWDIDNALEKFRAERLDSLFSSSPFYPYMWLGAGDGIIPIEAGQRTMRQKKKPLIHENGSIYIMGVKGLIKSKNRLFGKIGHYQMGRHQGLEIDSLEDLFICELLKQRGY
jgi:N-acylneuraminate cytidylyltransferase